MPRVEFSIPIAGSDCRIGLWKMTESEEELYAGVPELIRYRHVVCNMKSSARRLEFLCVRSLLMDMMGGMHGKPYLECGKNISISHTRGYVAVILSDNSDVAIDIEYMDERVCRIADRFLRDLAAHRPPGSALRVVRLTLTRPALCCPCPFFAPVVCRRLRRGLPGHLCACGRAPEARPRPYAYSTLMVFVLPLRPLMMPPVMMTLSPFSSCITFRLTCSAW